MVRQYHNASFFNEAWKNYNAQNILRQQYLGFGCWSLLFSYEEENLPYLGVYDSIVRDYKTKAVWSVNQDSVSVRLVWPPGIFVSEHHVLHKFLQSQKMCSVDETAGKQNSCGVFGEFQASIPYGHKWSTHQGQKLESCRNQLSKWQWVHMGVAIINNWNAMLLSLWYIYSGITTTLLCTLKVSSIE